MSYEGYEQHICKNGHRFDTGCSFWSETAPKCDICKAESAFSNAVDTTNCDEYGCIVDWSSLLLTAEVVETCNLEHMHVTKHETYRIPSEEEHTNLRTYHDGPEGF